VVKLNPLKKLKELKEGLPNIKEMEVVAKNQQQAIKIQVDEILKQTVLMERWANAQELQLEQLERVAQALEKMAEK